MDEKKFADVGRALERKTDQQVIVTRDHIEMIERRHLWQLPMLPLIRRRQHPDGDVGIIIKADSEPAYRVRLGNMIPVVLGVDWREMPIRDYASAAAIVADGWEVD